MPGMERDPIEAIFSPKPFLSLYFCSGTECIFLLFIGNKG
jgi:hypothetical protein